MADPSEVLMRALRPHLPPESGHELNVPAWVHENCPEIVAHYQKFPMFQTGWNEQLLALSDSASAAIGTCVMKVVHYIAASIDSHALLHAGSHLGAIVHGGQIPWDDDIDAIIPFQDRDKFLRKCADLEKINIPVRCHVYSNAVKVFSDDGENRTRHAWTFPFVDLFFYVVQEGFLYEVPPEGYIPRNAKRFRIDAFFPISPYYFGGVRLLGPAERIALERYDVNRCKLPKYNHRISLNLVKALNKHTNGSVDVDCNELSNFFPFLNDGEIHLGGTSHKVAGRSNINFSPPAQKIPLDTRQEYFRHDDAAGSMLTQKIPNLDKVEVVNTIGPGCEDLSKISVVVFNMQRGVYWLETTQLLRKFSPDVIILNEMDIGMARSGQQHTARLLALELQMNYAWALEFVELTRGTKQEQAKTQNLTDFEGLHGNAILSKCQLHDAVVFRDEIGGYFSDQKVGLNAGGFEKRLGGRMVVLAKISSRKSQNLVIGAMHKVNSLNSILTYANGHPIILGGDQGRDTCAKLRLQLSNNSNNAWPAKCAHESFGHGHGDILCASTKDHTSTQTTVYLPCFSSSGLVVQLSDHAVLHTQLDMALLSPVFSS